MIHTSYFMLHRLFFYLTILLLPTQFGYHFWPSWAMVLGRRVDYLAPTVYLTDLLLVGTLIFWWLSRLKQEAGSMKPENKFILHTSYFILLVFGVVNILFAQNSFVAVYRWFKVLEFLLFGYYIVKTKPSVLRIVFFLSLSVLYSSGIAIAQFILQRSIGGLFWFLGERTFTVATSGIARIALGMGHEVLRAYGTFPHPNVLGGFLAIVLPLIINQLLNSLLKINPPAIRLIMLVSVIFGTLALVLTFSRSAWMVGIVGLSFIFLYRCTKLPMIFSSTREEAGSRKQEAGNKTIRMVYLVASVIMLLASYFIFHKYASYLVESESYIVRRQLNDASIAMFLHSPLFGVGLGNFLVALPSYLVSREIYFLQPAHNIYLLVLSELGIVGIGLIGYIVAVLLKYEAGSMKYDIGKNTDHSILRTSCFMLLLLGFVDHYPLTLQQGQMLVAVLIALCMKYEV